MKREPKKLDRYFFEYTTHAAKSTVDEAIQRAKAVENDTDKERRLKVHECCACFYLRSKIGGAAMTMQPCASCNVDQMYGSTCTDVLCLACAQKYSLCKHCGGDLGMRIGRRVYPISDVPSEQPKPAGTGVFLLPLKKDHEGQK